MNSQQVNYFLSICKNHSFSKTAAQFYVSQPTVSTQISALEKELGIILLERTRNYVSLTPAGQAYADFFAHAQNRADELCRLYGGQKDTATYLVVGLLHALQPPALTEYFTRFHKEHPAIDLQLRSMNPSRADIQKSLLERHIDILFTFYSPSFDNSAVSWMPILESRFVFFASADDPHFRSPDCSVRDFSDRTLIVPNVNADAGYQQILQRIRQRYGLQYMHTEIVPALEAICLSVACGLGVSILNEYTVNGYPGLTALDVGETAQLVAVWHKDNKNPNLQTFLNDLKSQKIQP